VAVQRSGGLVQENEVGKRAADVNSETIGHVLCHREARRAVAITTSRRHRERSEAISSEMEIASAPSGPRND